MLVRLQKFFRDIFNAKINIILVAMQETNAQQAAAATTTTITSTKLTSTHCDPWVQWRSPWHGRCKAPLHSWTSRLRQRYRHVNIGRGSLRPCDQTCRRRAVEVPARTCWRPPVCGPLYTTTHIISSSSLVYCSQFQFNLWGCGFNVRDCGLKATFSKLLTYCVLRPVGYINAY